MGGGGGHVHSTHTGCQEESGTPRAMGGQGELSLNLGLWGGSLKKVTSELRFEGLGGVKGQALEG